MSGVERFDLEAFRWMHLGWRNPVFDVFFLVAAYIGLGQTPGILVLVFAFQPARRAYAIPLAATGTLIALFAVHAIKSVVPRDRPSRLPFALPQERFFDGSFPSGHTTVAFSTATMLWLLTRGTPDAWMGRAAWPIAVCVGLSRIYRGVHWPTDVLGGACLGVAGACAVWFGWNAAISRRDRASEA